MLLLKSLRILDLLQTLGLLQILDLLLMTTVALELPRRLRTLNLQLTTTGPGLRKRQRTHLSHPVPQPSHLLFDLTTTHPLQFQLGLRQSLLALQDGLYL